MNGPSAPWHRPEANGERPGTVRAAGFLNAGDCCRLIRFFLGFDVEARRSRFGEAVSDEDIVTYCADIKWRRSILIAQASGDALEAVVEIHPSSQQWDSAELIASSPETEDRGDVFAQLLQIAAFAAASRGCRTVLVPLDDTSRELLPLLQNIGRVRIATTQAHIDLGGYALSRGARMPAAAQANTQFS